MSSNGSVMVDSANQVFSGAPKPHLIIELEEANIFGLFFAVLSDCDRWIVTDFSLKATGIVHYIVRIGEKDFSDSTVRL